MRRAVEDLRGGRVGRVDAPLRVDHQHAHRRGVDQAAQLLLAVAQGAALVLELADHVVEVLGQLADGVAAADLGAHQVVAGGKGVGHGGKAAQSALAALPVAQAEENAERQRQEGEQGEQAGQLEKGHGQTGPAKRRVTLAERPTQENPG
ncbi:hypothetical protein D3C78_1425470 [compost metagenome]